MSNSRDYQHSEQLLFLEGENEGQEFWHGVEVYVHACIWANTHLDVPLVPELHL